MNRERTKQPIAVIGEVIKETDKAYLFEVSGEEVWLPKSQCEWDEGDKTMHIPEWLVREKGLE